MASPGQCIWDSFSVAEASSGGLYVEGHALDTGQSCLPLVPWGPWWSLLEKLGLEEHSLEAMTWGLKAPQL